MCLSLGRAQQRRDPIPSLFGSLKNCGSYFEAGASV
jgi:hypothetical protein